MKLDDDGDNEKVKTKGEELCNDRGNEMFGNRRRCIRPPKRFFFVPRNFGHYTCVAENYGATHGPHRGMEQR